MLIDYIRFEFPKPRPEKLETRIRRRRSGAGYEFDLGMFFFQGFRKPGVPLNILGAPLFVSDTQHLHAERLGMSPSRRVWRPTGWFPPRWQTRLNRGRPG